MRPHGPMGELEDIASTAQKQRVPKAMQYKCASPYMRVWTV
jgi:hypothetical protein